ncbi:tetratricopeptide repeat protein [Paenibacillus sp. 481]|uniref:tetratricopeptide repeat protein n=1 Tax=Paenibacillus sp. 481 TaxID=2835869 RepID=UPI001E53B17A|nr:tetratricopeptide repeat protein [Paenibacillus sp. 481]
MDIREIPFNMNFEFDHQLRELPVDLDAMKRGIAFLKLQFELVADGKTAGLIGVYSRIVRDLEDAEYYLRMAVQFHEQAGNDSGIVANQIRLANALHWADQFDEADQLLLQTLDKVQQEESLQGYEDFVCQHLGKSKFDQRKYSEALTWFEQALAIRRQKGNDELIQSSENSIRVTRLKYITE